MTTKATGQPGDLVMGGVTEWIADLRAEAEKSAHKTSFGLTRNEVLVLTGSRLAPLVAHTVPADGIPSDYQPQPASAPVGVDAAVSDAGHISFDSMTQCANAWLAVVSVLDEVCPDWRAGKGTCLDDAIAAIRAIAQQPAAHDASTALRSIYDLLGVNTESDAGAEIARLHIIEAKPKKPAAVDEAPTYRLLSSADEIRADDEFLGDDTVTWLPVGKEFLSASMCGKKYNPSFLQPMRRALAQPQGEG